MKETNTQITKSSQMALASLKKLKNEEYQDIISKLEWCMGSYANDGNPEGLLACNAQSLEILKAEKQAHPRKVNKKTIEGLEKVLA